MDNLGREAAPAQAWPVNPTAGRFLVREEAGRLVIDADNGLRYAPFVQLVESVDLRDAVALYLRWYPALQQACESIGFNTSKHLGAAPKGKWRELVVDDEVALTESLFAYLEATSFGQ